MSQNTFCLDTRDSSLTFCSFLLFFMFAQNSLTAFRAPSTSKGDANTSSPVCYTALTSPLAQAEKQNAEAVFTAAKLNVSVCSVSNEATWHQTPQCPRHHTLSAAQAHQPHTSCWEWPLTHSISKPWLLFER